MCYLSNGRAVVSAEELAMSARESISSYCYEECLAYCCRRGYLLLSEKEADLLQMDIKDLILMPVDKRYIFNLAKGCPNLTDFKCTIHKDQQRPKACKEFPLFIFEKTIIVTEDCPAVKQNMLYPFLAEFKTMGYALVYTSK
jgi:Fe-S-cluster containining protein